MIEFIEKTPWIDKNPFIGTTYVPVFMVKDGKEYFVRNRDKNQKQSDVVLNAIKEFLTQTDGQYFKEYGIYENPFDMLRAVIDGKYTFFETTVFDDCRGIDRYGGGFIDFSGNFREVAAAFSYRIYDTNMYRKLCSIVKLINKKNWSAAQKEIGLQLSNQFKEGVYQL